MGESFCRQLDRLEINNKENRKASKRDSKLHQSTLMEIAAKAPTTKSELLSVKGFGEAKFRKYGEDILRICRGEV
ncbi:MAG: HRDC domain-containing protein [Bacteroidales bacterium]|nr:HRDC domain-containing protein [Bacteroidales bacterium]MDY6170969.1 HRDC domain-containing protein [Candidatus Cryptobacteroides sp.]